MLSYLLLWVLVLIIGTAVCFRILHSIAKTAAIIGFIAILFVAITVGITYSDIQELKEELKVQEQVILIHNKGEVTFSTVQKGWGEANEYKQVPMTDEEIQKAVKKERLKYIKTIDSYYKVILADREIFSELDSAALNIIEDSSMNYEERTEAYNILQGELLQEKGLIYIVQEYKEGNIIIYPKTMFFRVIEVIPDNWTQKLMSEE
jgi:hypothetical protein